MVSNLTRAADLRVGLQLSIEAFLEGLNVIINKLRESYGDVVNSPCLYPLINNWTILLKYFLLQAVWEVVRGLIERVLKMVEVGKKEAF